MKKIVVSKSTKPRSGARYTLEGKQIDRTPRQWKMVINHFPAGYNRKDGKEAMTSRTSHVPA